jgi:1-deoxy-D-xylulose-5-phosphate synthase
VAVTVVDPRWVLPVPDALVGLAAAHELVVTVSDCGRHGGFGSALADVLRSAECDVPQRDLALPQRFLEHGNRADVLAAVGLTAQDVARRVTEWASALPGADVGGDRGRTRRLGARDPRLEPEEVGVDDAGGVGPGEQAR